MKLSKEDIFSLMNIRLENKDTEASFVLDTSGTAPLNPCHALL